MRFELNEKQVKQLNEWKEKVYAKGVERQKKTVKKSDPFYSSFVDSWEMGYPYTGTIGGQFKYQFTPNSIGETVSVVDAVTGENLELTDFSTW